MIHGWPNRSTWLMAVWLSSTKVGYCQEVVLAAWRKFPADKQRSSKARAWVAEKFSRDVAANIAQVQLREDAIAADELAHVDWAAIADHDLQRFRDYEPLG